MKKIFEKISKKNSNLKIEKEKLDNKDYIKKYKSIWLKFLYLQIMLNEDKYIKHNYDLKEIANDIKKMKKDLEHKKNENLKQKKQLEKNENDKVKIAKALGFIHDFNVDLIIKNIKNLKQFENIFYDSIKYFNEYKDILKFKHKNYNVKNEIKSEIIKLKEKADKYDNLHIFSKNINNLLNLKESNKDNIIYRDKTYPNHIFIKGNCKISTGEDECKWEQGTIMIPTTDKTVFENNDIIKQDYILKFDYAKFEKLYDFGCKLISYYTKIPNQPFCSYEINILKQKFRNINIRTEEFTFHWRVFKDEKQLTKEEIEEIIND